MHVHASCTCTPQGINKSRVLPMRCQVSIHTKAQRRDSCKMETHGTFDALCRCTCNRHSKIHMLRTQHASFKTSTARANLLQVGTAFLQCAESKQGRRAQPDQVPDSTPGIKWAQQPFGWPQIANVQLTIFLEICFPLPVYDRSPRPLRFDPPPFPLLFPPPSDLCT